MFTCNEFRNPWLFSISQPTCLRIPGKNRIKQFYFNILNEVVQSLAAVSAISNRVADKEKAELHKIAC